MNKIVAVKRFDIVKKKIAESWNWIAKNHCKWKFKTFIVWMSQMN